MSSFKDSEWSHFNSPYNMTAFSRSKRWAMQIMKILSKLYVCSHMMILGTDHIFLFFCGGVGRGSTVGDVISEKELL